MILNLVPFSHVCHCDDYYYYYYYKRMFRFSFDVVQPVVNNKIVIELNTKERMENGTISVKQQLYSSINSQHVQWFFPPFMYAKPLLNSFFDAFHPSLFSVSEGVCFCHLWGILFYFFACLSLFPAKILVFSGCSLFSEHFSFFFFFFTNTVEGIP